MLKKLTIALIILIALGAAVLVFALFNINSLVAHYKPELERIASETLGTNVELGELSTSIFPKAKIAAREVKIGANDIKQHRLAVAGVELELQLRPLLSNELRVDTLKVDAPSITVVRSAGGTEIAGLARKQVDSTTATQAQAERSKPAPPQLKISLNGLSVHNGNVDLLDLRENAPAFLKKISLKDFSVESSLDLSGNEIKIPTLDFAAILLDRHKIKAKLNAISFDSNSGALKAPDGHLTIFDQTIDFSSTFNTKNVSGLTSVSIKSFDLSKLAGLSELPPLVGNLKLTGSVSSKLSLQLSDKQHFKVEGSSNLDKIGLSLADHVISDLGGDVETTFNSDMLRALLTKLSLQIDKQPVTLDGSLNYEIRTGRADLSLERLKAFDGQVSSQTKIALAQEISFDTSSSATALSIASLLSFLAPAQPARMTGTIDQLKLDLSGKVNSEITRNTSGQIILSISKGSLVGLNLVAKVLNKVNSIPLISGALSAYVPQQYQGVLSSPDTPIRSLSGSFAMKNGSLLTKDLHIESDVFSIDVAGTITLKSDLNLNTTIYFTKEFSAALAASIPALKKILAADGRLTFPLAIQGNPDSLVITPNLDKLIELAGKRALKDGADRLLDQTLKKTPGGSEAKKAIEGLLGF